MEDGEIYDRDHGFCWIVGRIEARVGLPARWYLQGVADDQNLAIQMCRDRTYFIGPVPINTALPEKVQEWPGHYFPLKVLPQENNKNEQ